MGHQILEQSAFPNSGLLPLPSEYAFLVHPPRERLFYWESNFFSLILVLNLIQFVEQIRKRCYLCLVVSSCPKNISQCEYEVHIEHGDRVKKI